MLKRTRLVVLLAALGLFVIGVVAWADVPLPNPNPRGEAESVEQAAEQTARKYLAPLLNKPTVRTAISVEDCKRTGPAWNLCTMKVDGAVADCTLKVRLRLFKTGRFSAYGKSLRCS